MGQRPIINKPDWTPPSADLLEPTGAKKLTGWQSSTPAEKPLRRHMNWLFYSISAFLTWLMGTSADEYYVDSAAGSDSAAGASTTPLATFGAAIAKVRPGHPTIIYLKGGQTHTVAADASVYQPQLLVDSYDAGTATLSFSTYISGGTANAIYGINVYGGQISFTSTVSINIPNAAHPTNPWSNTLRGCFRTLGAVHIALSGTQLTVGTASSGNGKPAIVQAYENGFVAVTLANLGASAITTGNKAYVLELGGVPSAGGAETCHSCGSLIGDSTVAAGIDNTAYLVAGQKTITTAETQAIFLNAEPSAGTFDLNFSGTDNDLASEYISAAGIAYNAAPATIATAIDGAFSAAGWPGITSSVTTITGAGGGVTAVYVTLAPTPDSWAGVGGGPRMTCNPTGLTGPTKTFSRITQRSSERKHINLTTNLEL